MTDIGPFAEISGRDGEREALARALRSNRYGDIRPSWDALQVHHRMFWLGQAEYIISTLARSGWIIQRKLDDESPRKESEQ